MNENVLLLIPEHAALTAVGHAAASPRKCVALLAQEHNECLLPLANDLSTE
jgi:hypothetical protein